jgi:tetratricopeptide (TPR) repeat protein
MNRKERRAAKSQGNADPGRPATAGSAGSSRQITERLAQALAHHRAGRLVEAEALYRQIQAVAPRHVDNLYLLGVLLGQRGRADLAIDMMGEVLTLKPDFVQAHNDLGVLLLAQSKPTEAMACFERALALKLDSAEANFNQGVALAQLDRLDDAATRYERALTLKPEYHEAHYNLGNVHKRQGRLGDASLRYRRALALRPDYMAAHNAQGAVLLLQDEPRQALACFEQALALEPDNVEALNNRGSALRRMKLPAEALASFERALALKPDFAQAHYNRGNALQDLERPAEALASFEQALAIRPRYPEALNNRGNALRELNRPAEALASFDQALALKPDLTEAHYDRGLALVDLGRPAEALASYGNALALDPDHVETHWNRSWLRLRLADFDAGWEEYEWRWRTRDAAHFRRDFAQPLWLGEAPLAGKTILLHDEQGFGDAIQFVRYVPLVAARAGKVILEVQPPLKALLSKAAGAARVLGRGEELPAFDCHCPLVSLPLAFKTRLDTIPTTVPYLSASDDRVTKWRQRLPSSGKPRIGIAWAGSPAFKGDRTRSIGLPRFAPLLAAAGVEFYSIQRELRAGDREILSSHPHVVHLGDTIADFDDTAAIISLLDLVISSDTSVVHLAGAMGKPLWILLQYVADWRWLLDRRDSPWYPTARLFRQPEMGDWESVVARVGRELTSLGAGR